MSATPHRLPEQTFFADPATDRLLAMVMALASEFWVLNDRVRAMETLLDGKGVLRRADLDGYEPDARTAQEIAGERQAFVRSLMENVLALQKSRGAP